MRRAMFTAFDEHIPAGGTSAAPVFTSAELNNRLGQWDQLAVQVIVDNVTGSPPFGGLDLYIEHSADGRNFLPVKAGVPIPPQAGSGDVVFPALANNATNVR